MYKYIYVKTRAGDFWRKAIHQEIIDKYAEKGYRFVTVIPTYSTDIGKVNELELVFEKKEEEL